MREFYTPAEIKDMLKIVTNKVYVLLKKPDFPKIIIGKNYIVPKEDFDAWVNRQVALNGRVL